MGAPISHFSYIRETGGKMGVKLWEKFGENH